MDAKTTRTNNTSSTHVAKDGLPELWPTGASHANGSVASERKSGNFGRCAVSKSYGWNSRRPLRCQVQVLHGVSQSSTGR